MNLYALLVTSLLLVCVAWADPERSEISGKVLSIESSSEKDPGVHVKLQTESGVLRVRIAQRDFASVSPKVGDPLTVVGFRFTFDKTPGFVAEKVKKESRK